MWNEAKYNNGFSKGCREFNEALTERRSVNYPPTCLSKEYLEGFFDGFRLREREWMEQQEREQ